MRGSRPVCVKSASSAKELWWSAGCGVASPTALAPETALAYTAPTFNSPGRKRPKPCRGAYRLNTQRSTVNGSKIVSASNRSSSKCKASLKRRTATCCPPKSPQKQRLNPGICLAFLDNPAFCDHCRSAIVQNHLILRGFHRCQKVAAPCSFW